MKLLTGLVLVLVAVTSLAAAEPSSACIVAPGIAVTQAAPDSLTVDFSLDTASDSFDQGDSQGACDRG